MLTLLRGRSDWASHTDALQEIKIPFLFFVQNPFGQFPIKLHFALWRQVTHIETGLWGINLSGATNIRWNRQVAQFICCAAKGRRTGCTSMESMTGMYKGAGARFISKQHDKPERVQHRECTITRGGDGSLGATDGFRGEDSVVLVASLYCRSTLRFVQLSDSSSGGGRSLSIALCCTVAAFLCSVPSDILLQPLLLCCSSSSLPCRATLVCYVASRMCSVASRRCSVASIGGLSSIYSRLMGRH